VFGLLSVSSQNGETINSKTVDVYAEDKCIILLAAQVPSLIHLVVTDAFCFRLQCFYTVGFGCIQPVKKSRVLVMAI